MSQTPSRGHSMTKDERERRRRIRESVQKYYDVENTSSSNNNQNQQQQHQRTTSNTNNNNTAASNVKQNMDLDSTSFNATAYTTSLMRQSTLPKLLETDTVLRHSVKSLDKELQDLVYSNYSKFIAAAETIKEVRSSVLDMENKLQDLDENVEKMESVSGRVTRELDRHRHLVDQEVATNSMLRKVQFLVMLPQIMENAAKAEKWIEAAQYWSAGDAIFTKYSEFPSFVRTQNDCRLKAEQLYASLSRKICVDDTSSLMANPSNNKTNNTNSSSDDQQQQQQGASSLSSKLAALRLLASTSVDTERLQKKLNVVLVPNIHPETKKKDLGSVLEKASTVLYKKVFNEFQEQTKDTIAHVRLDFLHRKEDLERHAKKVQSKLLLQKRNKENNNTNKQNEDESSSSASSLDDPVQLAEEIKSSLMDLSVALRKRYIAKLEEIIRDSFRKLSRRMAVIQSVVASCCQHNPKDGNDNNNNDDESNNNNNDQQKETSTTKKSEETSSLPTTSSILEQALKKILDEICSCTTTWMSDCLNTFSDCIVDASLAFNSNNKSSSSSASLLLLNASDVDTLINGMCSTFFDAILDTESTFVGIGNRFLSSRNSTNSREGSPKSIETNNEQQDDYASSYGSESNLGEVLPSTASRNFASLVSRKTEKLFSDLQHLLSSKEAEVTPRIAEALDEEKFSDEVEFYDDDKKFYAKEEAITRTLVPLVCYSSFARAAASVLPKSDLAEEISWIHGHSNSSNMMNSNKAVSNASRASQQQFHEDPYNNDFDADLKLQELAISFENVSVSLASSFLRFCRLTTLTGEIRRGFFSSKFGFEATEPSESSDMISRVTRAIRHRAFVIQLLFSSRSFASTSSTSNTSNTSQSSSSSQRKPSLFPNFPLVAQFMRKDVVGGVRADMDRIFAPKSGGASSGNTNTSSDGTDISNNNGSGFISEEQQHLQQQNAARSRLLRVNPSSWYAVCWPMDASSITETLVIMVLTSTVETVRESAIYFSKAGSQQLQVDASFLLHVISELKMTSNNTSNNNVKGNNNAHNNSTAPLISSRVDDIVIALVNEFACSVFDRTKERSPLSNSVVEQIAFTSWKKTVSK